MKRLGTILAVFLAAGCGSAGGSGERSPKREDVSIHTEPVQYKHGDVVLEGFLAYPESLAGKRPGILVIHEWTGHGPYVRRRAEQLAHLGYVAFALDMYGKGVFAKDHEEAARLAGVYFKDRALMRARAQAGLEVLQHHPRCDARRIVAMGYCFGGTSALELGRGGADLVGIATFHANLSNPAPESAKIIKGKVIIFHGGDDSFVNPQVDGFQQEMRQAKVDWQFVTFGGAVHSFTVKEAGNDPSKGMAYNAAADRRSWSMLLLFLDELFG